MLIDVYDPGVDDGHKNVDGSLPHDTAMYFPISYRVPEKLTCVNSFGTSNVLMVYSYAKTSILFCMAKV